MIKVGLVGLGFMGKMHYSVHKESDKSKVVAICDVDERKLQGDLPSNPRAVQVERSRWAQHGRDTAR